MKLYLDPGHGGRDPGAVGNELQEKEVVLDIALRMKRILRDYPSAVVKLSREKDETKSLAARTNEANQFRADIFLSIHCNAFNGKARGYEDFIYNRLPANAKARTYQNVIHQKIATAISLPNRGKRQANFHVLRESKMPAILTENGFIDHPDDAKLMKQAAWREKVAAAQVEGLVEIFNLKRSIENVNDEMYKVIAGSFQQRANAEARKTFLLRYDVSAKVKQVTLQGKVFYRVLAGYFANRKEAEAHLKKLTTLGIEAFISK